MNTLRNSRTLYRSSIAQLAKRNNSLSSLNLRTTTFATAAIPVSGDQTNPVPVTRQNFMSELDKQARELDRNVRAQDSKSLKEDAKYAVGFLGTGKMATAMMGGLDASGICDYKSIAAFDIDEVALKDAADKGAACLDSAQDVVSNSDVIFLSVKPDIIPAVLERIAPNVDESKLVVSVAAGVSIETIESKLPEGARVIRVMPNTPSVVRMCASGYSKGTHATDSDMTRVGEILDSLGIAVKVPEEKLHAVTGVSGSGPAYVLLFIEALSDAGVRQGLTRADALKLATQTVKGTAEMLESSTSHPAVLRDNVCSPGGTTIAAVEALEKGSFRSCVMGAVSAAAEQSKHLSKSKA